MCYLSAWARLGTGSSPSGVCKKKAVISFILKLSMIAYLGNVVDSYSLASFHDESNRQRNAKELTLLNRGNLICLGIGDLDTEFLLDSHDNLNGVERVESEITCESSSG